jgi:tetratricopeptide (TPR) repeat protein
MVGAFGEVQVMDWGLAKLLSSGSRGLQPAPALDATVGTVIHSGREPDSETQAGDILGTYPFMPPEQAIGAIDQIDERADVFGLGAILCVMLTGKPPYVADTIEAIRQLAARAKLDDAIQRLDASGAEPDLISLAKRCLSPERDDRPRNASEVAAAVAALRAAAEERAKQAEIDRAKAEVHAQEQRKRRRVMLAAGGVVAAVLLVGMGLSLWQMNRAIHAEAATALQLIKTEEAEKLAVAETERAKAALEIANARTKSLADTYGDFVFGIQDKLRTRPGTLELSKDLLMLARTGMKKIIDDARKQGNADQTIVWSYLRLGDVELRLGNTAAAKAEYDAGHELAKSLAEADPKIVQAQHDLGISYNRLGDVTLQLGQTKEALEIYQKSLAVSQRLAETDPKNAQAQRNLSISFERLGNVTLLLGQTKEALNFYQKYSAITQRLAEADPRNAQAQHDLSISYERLGNVNLMLGQTQDALDFYQKSLAVRQRLAEADPKNAEALRGLSVSYNKLSDVTLLLGQTQEALDICQKSLVIAQRLAEEDPKNTQAQRDLSISYEKLGTVNLRLGRTENALESYKKKLAIDQRLAEADPKNALAQRDLGVGYERLGDVMLRLDQSQDALDLYQKSLTMAQRLAEADPKNAEAQTDLFVSFYKLGSFAKVIHEYSQAADWFAKGRAHLLPWHEKNMLGSQFKNAVPHMDREIALCRNAAEAIANLDFVFTLKPEQIPGLLAIRVKTLLHRKQPADAVATAERFATWAETREKDRDGHRYNAASAFALCANPPGPPQAGGTQSPPKTGGTQGADEKLVEKALALLEKAKAGGYFTAPRIEHIKQDTDFDGIRQHPKFAAFVQTLSAKPKEK